MAQEPSEQKKQKPYNSYLRYSSLGLQFMLVIGLATYGGYRLDQYLSFRFPVFTLSFCMLALVGMVYKLYRILSNL